MGYGYITISNVAVEEASILGLRPEETNSRSKLAFFKKKHSLREKTLQILKTDKKDLKDDLSYRIFLQKKISEKLGKIDSLSQEEFLKNLKQVNEKSYQNLDQEDMFFMLCLRVQLIDNGYLPKNLSFANSDMIREYIWAIVRQEAIKKGYVKNDDDEKHLKYEIHSQLAVGHGLNGINIRNYVFIVLTQMGNDQNQGNEMKKNLINAIIRRVNEYKKECKNKK